MKEDVAKPWIIAGYQIFAYEGPTGLKIERLSKKISKNKSSFYHLFTDVEIFTDYLLKYHLEQAEIIAEKESNCLSKEELIDVLIEHKIDLLFNRQLRIHRENRNFEACFSKTSEMTVKSIIGIWSEIIDLKSNSYLAELVFKLSLENFFLQITDETINHNWLNNYFDELRMLVRAFQKNEKSAIER